MTLGLLATFGKALCSVVCLVLLVAYVTVEWRSRNGQ